MKLAKTIAACALAGVMAFSMTACSASSANINALVNSQLASSGAGYTVTSFSTDTSTVNLIKEAVSAYADYKGYLVNTDDLADDLSDDGYAATSGYYINEMNKAKAGNLKTKANFDESLASFAARGIGEAYQITTDDVADIGSDEAVAEYVATLVTGSAKVYVSDVVAVPVLDDAEGSYTGATTSMRYVYIQYTE